MDACVFPQLIYLCIDIKRKLARYEHITLIKKNQIQSKNLFFLNHIRLYIMVTMTKEYTFIDKYAGKRHFGSV